jgi:signal transduction histidine kinase
MKAATWVLAAVLGAGLLLAELAMDVSTRERRDLYTVFGLLALATLLATLVVLGVAKRLHSLRATITVVAFSAVAVTGAVVAVAALTMFIEPHDLTLVLVAILLGVGLGGVVAGAVAGPLTADLAAISQTAERLGAGDLGGRTGIDRADELGKAASALDDMAARLAAAEEERRKLLSAIGHDLRTPLSSMQAAVEALQDGVAPDPPAYLRGLSRDLGHLSHLVDDLFLLARIEAGRLELSMMRIDLSELADEAVEALAPVAARKRVKLQVQSPGRVGVSGDPAALGRVFRNLLTNAVRHSPEAGEVTIRLDRNGNRVEAAVVDEGAGFPESIRGRAFERFVRADDSRSRESGGSGLGLAIAKGIVEAHGGEISIDHGPGGRVRFSVPSG